MRVLILVGALLLTQFAHAAPPEGADMTHAPWYRSLMVPNNPENPNMNPNMSCCNVSDCRPVRYRMSGSQYEAFIDKKTFGVDNAPNAWVKVPDATVLRQKDNPTGEGVLCFYKGEVRCFVPASGT